MSSVSVNPPKTPVTKGSQGRAPANLPNICKMPGPPAPFVPAPLPNLGQSFDKLKKCTKKVKIEDNAIAIKGSFFHSMGDIPSKGTGGGMVSATTHGKTKFVAPGSMNTKAEGKNIQLLGDAMTNNNSNPSNSGILPGELQGPLTVPNIKKALQKLAECCNQKENCAAKACPKGPSGEQCTYLGTKKHKCCEKAIKKYNKENKPDPPLRSEVAFQELKKKCKVLGEEAASEARKKAASAYKKAVKDWMAKHSNVKNALWHARRAARKGKVWWNAFKKAGGGTFIADVLVGDPPQAAFDFKFSCKKKGSVKITEKQRQKYRKCTGHFPEPIHEDGRNCPKPKCPKKPMEC